MGAGIAQLACLGGYRTLLHDSDPRAVFGGLDRAVSAIEKGVKRGRWSVDESVAAIGRLEGARDLDRLAECELVIEAAPEDLELKRALFARVGELAPGAVLATNTSSLSVSAIAERTPGRERVVGMHFFNPPPAMKLVEIVAGESSSDEALALATRAADAMGRTPIRARDSAGFVGNRCARPFTLESLRMLEAGIATHEEIDRICRIAGGFRMGPFELMDLVGLDVNFAVATSLYEQSGRLARWRPSPIQERLVSQGRLGRKAGRGFYEYPDEGPYRDPDPEIDTERPILDTAELESTAGPSAPDVVGRLFAQIANEGSYALEEGVASAADIDTAMRLGFNWPLGPLELGDRFGPARALGILDPLAQTEGEAYEASPVLRRAAERGGPIAASA
jgi:3-hydroxybutyryl-CoA dehydrogenase